MNLVLEAEGALFDVDLLDAHRLRSDTYPIPAIGGIVVGVEWTPAQGPAQGPQRSGPISSAQDPLTVYRD